MGCWRDRAPLKRMFIAASFVYLAFKAKRQNTAWDALSCGDPPEIRLEIIRGSVPSFKDPGFYGV